jgi:hypothetical protein
LRIKRKKVRACSVADWTATMIGPIKMPDGKVIQPHKTPKLESAPLPAVLLMDG